MSPMVVGIIVIALIVLISAWDAWLAVDRTKNNTISTVVREWFLSMVWIYYAVSFVLGFLMGHWSPV